MKEVLRGAPAKSTFAPDINLLPVTEMLKAPVAKDGGLTDASTGVGLRRVTVPELFAEESAALTAEIVAVAGFGRVAGDE